MTLFDKDSVVTVKYFNINNKMTSLLYKDICVDHKNQIFFHISTLNVRDLFLFLKSQRITKRGLHVYRNLSVNT